MPLQRAKHALGYPGSKSENRRLSKPAGAGLTCDTQNTYIMRNSTHHDRPSYKADDIKIVAHVVRYLWPPDCWATRVRVLVAIALLLVGKGLNVYVPFALKSVIDSLAPISTPATLPLWAILAYGVARVGSRLCNELRDLVFINVAQATLRRMAGETFDHLLNLSLRFHSSRRLGALNSIVDRGLRGGQFVLSFLTFNVIPTIVEIVLVVFVLLWSLPSRYCFTTLLTISIYIAFTLLITEWRTAFRREMNQRENEASTKATDSLINYETVKFFSNESHEIQRFNAARRAYEQAALRAQRLMLVLNTGQGACIGVGLVAVMIFGASDVQAGTITVGEFVLANTMLIQLYTPLSFLGFVYREMKQGLVDLENMISLSSEKVEVMDPADSQDLQVSDGTIEFRNVHFHYDPDREILRGISLLVPAGTSLAIVGKTGAGKSTLAKLIFRFYDVTEGDILIDGQSIRHVTQSSLRRALAIVPQDTVLFNDTIGYNIQYGNFSASWEKVQQAAESAHLKQLIQELPKGYETQVGERGIKLSGGEKQRIGIARAVLKNSKILILDEATSSLDSKTERAIQSDLERAARDRTTIIIAHRLSTIVHSDNIVVLDKGKIVEMGNHDDLMIREGQYWELWQEQLRSTEE